MWAAGAWRSLVAHLHGVQVVAGSNPVAPTSKIAVLHDTAILRFGSVTTCVPTFTSQLAFSPSSSATFSAPARMSSSSGWS